MKYDFDHTPDHRSNASYRWAMEQFPDDVIGMGTADLDFTCAPCIKAALLPIAEENTYNYRQHTKEYYDAVTGWYQRNYGLKVEPEWLTNVPSTIGAVRLALGIFAKPGDKILVHGPTFQPLVWAVEGAGCTAVRNPIQLIDGHYAIDFEDFEAKLRDEKPSMFLLVNPHNPTGRVYTKDELKRMVELCAAYNVKIVSDEVHCLVLYDGNVHTPILAVSELAKKICIQIVSLSKGYNLMSLPHAVITIADPDMREKWNLQIQAHSFGYAVNSFAIAAVTSVMKGEADEWMEELTAYLKKNRDEMMEFLEKEQLPMKAVKPEGGFLLWIDMRESGWDLNELAREFTERTHIDLDNGADFGPEGIGFVRINYAVTNQNLKKALKRIRNAFQNNN